MRVRTWETLRLLRVADVPETNKTMSNKSVITKEKLSNNAIRDNGGVHLWRIKESRRYNMKYIYEKINTEYKINEIVLQHM